MLALADTKADHAEFYHHTSVASSEHIRRTETDGEMKAGVETER